MNEIVENDRYEPYTVIYQGIPLNPTFMIGKGHIYTLATRPTNPDDPDVACVDMYLRDWYRCHAQKSRHFILDSYYDEANVRCRRSLVDHETMFNVLKMFAFFCEVPDIELLDESRKITPTGCPWNLRIMNRLLKAMRGERPITFYERFGFRACNDYFTKLLSKPIRLEALDSFLPPDTKAFFTSNNWNTIEDIVHGMYALCNSEHIPEYDKIQTDFIHSIDLYYNRHLDVDDIHKASEAYLFRIPDLSRLNPTIKIDPRTEHRHGIITITLNGSRADINSILTTSIGGKRKRKTKRLKSNYIP
jgi:hypothetical protein